MNVKIKKSHVTGAVKAPPSKSYLHRLIIGAALADGKSIIKGFAESEDISATLDCISQLGAGYEIDNGTLTVCGNGGAAINGGRFYCRESGSTLRFFIPIALALGDGGEFYGTRRLIERGVSVYEDVLSKSGVIFNKKDESLSVAGKLTGGEYRLRGDVSSQFITGLLYALPLTDSSGDVIITTALESRPYVDMTIHALGSFGIKVDADGDRYHVAGGQKYKPVETVCEGDWSNAAFLYALNALGGDVRVEGLDENSFQGDKVCVSLFERVDRGEVINISDCPDLGPILFAAAAAKGGAHFTGTARLRLKESDRAASMARELAKFGIRVDVGDNTADISGTLHEPSEPLDGHNDHRIVMALAVLCTLCGGEIRGAQAVAKSWRDFFKVMQSIGAEVKMYDA